MPTSNHGQISKILELIIINNPNSILDIGVGFGKYGVLSREYLEFWDGREEYKLFTRRIDGVEAFGDYITPLHRYVYNNLYIGDIGSIIDSEITHSYDLVLMIDVIEHLTKEQGRELIEKVLLRNGVLFISTPKDIGTQGEIFHNSFEVHRSQWSKDDFAGCSHSFFIPDSENILVMMSKTSQLSKTKKNIIKIV